MATAIEYGLLNGEYLATDYLTFNRSYFDSFGRVLQKAPNPGLRFFDSMGKIRPVPRPA